MVNHVARFPIEVKKPNLQFFAVAEAVHRLAADQFAVPTDRGGFRMGCGKGAGECRQVSRRRCKAFEALHGFKGGISVAGEKRQSVRFPIPSNLQVGAVQFFRDDVAGIGRRMLQFVFCDEIIQIFNRPPFVKQRFHRVYPVLL